jgi:Uma2 family endonuclease
MTTVAHPPRPLAQGTIPLLHNGDRLTREEFERRYRAMPEVNKAELVEGIVYMPSPVRATCDGQPHADLVTWMNYHRSKTPGLIIVDNGTVRLDEDNERQPDVMLLIPQAVGGAARIDEDDYVTGPPELIGEVAASSVSIDLHAKLNAYRRNGVREYLVWRTEEAAVDWFVLRRGQYVPLGVGPDSLIRSEVFPGLWLDPAALLRGELGRLFAVLDTTVREDDHASFIRRLEGGSKGQR